MNLKRGQEVTLNGLIYRIADLLGAGAVADVYAAELEGQPVALKLLSDRWQIGGEEDSQFRREGEVLRLLNPAEDKAYASRANVRQRLRWATETSANRIIVALLDEGQDVSGRPFVVQELAPPKVEVRPVQTPYDEHRALAILRRVAQGMTLAHQSKLSLRDFEPRTKIDRFRVREDADGKVLEVRLIDWNITGGSEPEEIAKDLFYFGGHAYHLMLGQHLDLESDGRPPHTLGLGLTAWNSLSEGSRSILTRLLNREPTRRYPSAAELVDDLAWLERSTEIALYGSNADRLRDRAYEARGQGRFDRLLAVADLALRRFQPGDANRQAFETLRAQAREELDKHLWQPLAMARVSLLAKQYGQAVGNFQKELDRLDPRSEPARLARYLKLQAQVGQALRSSSALDPSGTREWTLLNQGVQFLIQRAWVAADREFQRADNVNPALKDNRAFQMLEGKATTGQLMEDAARQRPGPPDDDATSSDWLDKEAERIKQLVIAVGLLKQAADRDADELFLGDAYQAYDRELQERQTLLPMFRSADDALAEGRFQDALTSLNKVEEKHPRHSRAQHLRSAAEEQKHLAERQTRVEGHVQAGQAAMLDGRYGDAIDSFRAAENLMPGVPAVADGLRAATAGLELLKIIEARIKQALQALQDGQADATGNLRQVTTLTQTTRSSLGVVAGWQGQPIDRLLVQAGLLAFGPVTGEHRLMFNQVTTARLCTAEDQVTVFTERQVKETLTRIEALWNDLRFEEALDLVRKIALLAGPGLQSQLDDWAKRLQNCSAVGEALAQQSASLRQRWSGGSTPDTDTAFKNARQLLAELVVESPDMPDLARTGARSLSAATLDFIGVKFAEADQTFLVPPLDPHVESFFGKARTLIEEVCKANLTAQAKAAQSANQFQATINILQNWRRSFGDLNGEQTALLRVAENAQRAADQAAEAAWKGQAEARKHVSKAEGFIRQESFDSARWELREAPNCLAAGDASEEARWIRGEVQRLWCKLIEANLALNKLQAARADLRESGVCEATPSLRDQIVEGWRRLVWAQREPGDALRTIQEAVAEITWCGQPEALNGERDLLQDFAQPVEKQVEKRALWLAPAAGGGEAAIQTAHKQLAVLETRLLKGLLVPERAWPSLRAWALAQQDVVKASLHEILADWDARAEGERRAQQYARVFDLARQGEVLVGDTDWAGLLAADLEALRRTAGMVRKAALDAVERDLVAAEQAWKGLDFAAARNLVGQARRRTDEVKDLLTEDLRVKLDGWDTRLEGCVGAEQFLGAALAAQSALAETATRDGVLRAFSPALAQAADADLPDRPREEARRLRDAVSARIESPDQPVALPALGEGAWPLLSDTRATIHRIVVADLLRRLAPARTAGQHETVIGLLNALDKLQPHLTAEQAGWLQVAERAVGAAQEDAKRRAEAKTNLEAAQRALTDQDYESARDRLTTALTRLPLSDDSDEATRLRNQGADTWQQLVRCQIEPEDALKYTSAGDSVLGMLSLGQALDRDLIPLKLTGEVRGQVEQFLPLAISEQATSVARQKIAELDRLLDALLGRQPWERLAAWTRGRQVVVMERIAAWLEYRLNCAEEAKTTDYAVALAAVNEGLTLAPQSRWRESFTDAQGKPVPIVEKLDRLEEIRREVEPLQKAREAFDRLRGELESGVVSLDSLAAADQMIAIPKPQDAYVSRCLGHLTRVRAVQEVAIATPEAGRNITHVLEKFFSTPLPAAETINTDWTWLGEQMFDLRSKFVERAKVLIGQLAVDLNRESAIAIKQPDSSLEALARAYWQARWGWAALGDPIYRGTTLFLAQMAPDTIKELTGALQAAIQGAIVEVTKAVSARLADQAYQVCDVVEAPGAEAQDFAEKQRLAEKLVKVRIANATAGWLAKWLSCCKEWSTDWVVLPRSLQLEQYPVSLPPLIWVQDATTALAALEQALAKSNASQRQDADIQLGNAVLVYYAQAQ